MFCIVSSGHLESAFPPVILHRKLSLDVAHQAVLSHSQSILVVLTLRLYACFASLPTDIFVSAMELKILIRGTFVVALQITLLGSRTFSGSTGTHVLPALL